MATFLVVLLRTGPQWDPSRPLEEQSGWTEHATFMDGLEGAGFIVLGGPLADEVRVAHAVDEPRDALGVHLERIAGAELGQRLRLGLCDAAEVDELVEEPLEAGRGDDLEDPRRLVSGVPECVPLVAGLEDQIAGATDQDL